MSSENLIRRRIAGLRRYLNYDWEDLGAGHIRATVPSFPYEALDVSGDKISPISLLKLFDSVSSGYFSTSDADWPTTGADGVEFIPMLYARNVALDVEPAFYDVRGQKFPLVVDTRLKYVKRASSCFEKTLFHATSGTLFAKLTGIDVNVDYVTRKPTPYPDWFRRKIISDIDEAKVEYTIPTKPQVGAFTSHHIIRFSDTDENRHTNYCILDLPRFAV